MSQIEFGATAAEEHGNILRELQTTRTAIHALGTRLAYFRARKLFRDLEPPFRDFPDYVTRGLGLSVSTAYRYVDAASFPAWCLERYGVEKTAELRKLVELTADDESPEQAAALLLPLADGRTKPFEEATAEEVRQARKLIKAGDGRVERPEDADRALLREAARNIEQRVERATHEWLAPTPVTARVRGGELVLDLRAIPCEHAGRIFEALANQV